MHLGLLLQFLDKHVMADVEAEKERNRNGFYTFDGAWVALKPGVTMLSDVRESEELNIGVVHSISGGIFEDPPVKWKVDKWSMAYNGKYVGRVLKTMNILKFDGEAKAISRIISPDDYETVKRDEQLIKLVKRGEMYWKLLRKQCKHYKGRTMEFPYNMVDGLVMADLRSFYAEKTHEKPNLMSASD